MKKFIKSEKGDIIILSAFLFVILIGFLALIVDVGVMFAYRGKMYEIANVMRDTRFTKNITIGDVTMSSTNPGEYFAGMLSSYARKNGFKGEITIIYKEKYPQQNKRDFKITIILKDKYRPKFLSLFGYKEMEVGIKLDGSGTSERSNIYYPWHDTTYSWMDYKKTFPAIH